MAREFTLVPRPVERVDTHFRRIVTDLPVPESLPLLEKLYEFEPRAMRGQPPVVWDRAEGFQVYDAWGNRWIDWSSGVLIANAGHGRQEIADAIAQQARSHMLMSFSFANQPRARLVEKLVSILPEPLKKVFLFSVGSEAVECAIKLCRTWGVKNGGRSKHVIVTYANAFHGRPMGAQQAGGIPELKNWIVNLDPGFVQVPFPDGFRTPNISFDTFESALRERGIEPQNVAGVMLESYQGGSAPFAPVASIDLVLGEALADRARDTGALLHQKLNALAARFPQIGRVAGKGLVAGLACVKPGTTEPNSDLAFDVVQRAMEKGVLMFAPVGFGMATG